MQALVLQGWLNIEDLDRWLDLHVVDIVMSIVANAKQYLILFACFVQLFSIVCMFCHYSMIDLACLLL